MSESIHVSELGVAGCYILEAALNKKILRIVELEKELTEIMIEINHNEDAHFKGLGECKKCQLKKLLNKREE